MDGRFGALYEVCFSPLLLVAASQPVRQLLGGAFN
jgi:hypothetical protein